MALISPRVKNRDWIQQAFILSKDAVSQADMQQRLLTFASWKYTDTTVGGSFSINTPPQYTRYADVKTGGRGFGWSDPDAYLGNMVGRYLSAPVSGNMGDIAPGSTSGVHNVLSRGMGRFYSEQMDDNGVLAHIRFGVPEFNSLTQFFGAFYDPQASAFARTARGAGFLYSLGKAIGAVVILPILPAVLGGKIIRFLSSSPPSKFYYLKPAMPMYWNAVNTLANAIAVNIGLIPRWFSSKEDQMREGSQGASTAMFEQYLKNYGNIADTGNIMDPNINLWGMKSGAGINIRAIATRSQKLANSGIKYMKDAYKDIQTMEQYRDKLRQAQIKAGAASRRPARSNEDYMQSYLDIGRNRIENYDQKGTESVDIRQQYNDPTVPGSDKMATIVNTNSGKLTVGDIIGMDQTPASPPAPQPTGSDGGGDAPAQDKPSPDLSVEMAESTKLDDKDNGSWFKYFSGAFEEGGEFVGFRVDNPGPGSESFSNSVRDSDLASKMNSKSAQSREKKFDFANGNIGSGMMWNAVEKVISGVGAIAQGTADMVGLSGVAALAGSAFVDIPKHWDNSIAQLPRADFTIELRSPYGNNMSRMQNLFIPLACILAGALPLSTGPHSYTSPFICEIYSKGRCAIRLGMIDSLSITRGQGNVGWTQDGGPLGIDVHFSVIDLSNILHMPIGASQGGWERLWMGITKMMGAVAGAVGGDWAKNSFEFLGPAALPSTYDENSSYNDYLGVLGNLGLQELTLSSLAGWSIRLANQRANFSSWAVPETLALWTSDVMPGRMVRNLVGYSARNH